jgi:hypothetical protein
MSKQCSRTARVEVIVKIAKSVYLIGTELFGLEIQRALTVLENIFILHAVN